MMVPTHAVWGAVLALPLAYAVPEFAPVALAAGFAGGVIPDLDMYAGHRKTLHYPVYYTVLAAPLLALAVLVPTAATVGGASLLLGAAFHSLTDVLGGGLELRPWEATSDRAVYDHHRDRWLAPRRMVRYDGAPEDLGLAVVGSLPVVLVADGPLQWVVGAALAVGVVYTAVRRHLPALAELVVQSLPATLLAYVPARYVDSS